MQLYLSQRPSLQQIKVKGDLLLTEANSNCAACCFPSSPLSES